MMPYIHFTIYLFSLAQTVAYLQDSWISYARAEFLGNGHPSRRLDAFFEKVSDYSELRDLRRTREDALRIRRVIISRQHAEEFQILKDSDEREWGPEPKPSDLCIQWVGQEYDKVSWLPEASVMRLEGGEQAVIHYKKVQSGKTSRERKIKHLLTKVNGTPGRDIFYLPRRSDVSFDCKRQTPNSRTTLGCFSPIFFCDNPLAVALSLSNLPSFRPASLRSPLLWFSPHSRMPGRRARR